MHVFQGLFFLLFGAGLLVIDYRSLSHGALPCGPNGLHGRLEFHRDQQPWLYWTMFLVYGVSGVLLVVLAVRLLLGIGEPLALN